MKKIVLFLILLVILSFSFRENSRSSFGSITIEQLSKKWKLDKYKVLFYSYEPEEIEKGDYLHFNSNMTYTSVSEGVYGTGNWSLYRSKKMISMTDDKEEGSLDVVVALLTDNKLVVYIEDSDDSEVAYLKIHFIAD